MAEPPPFQEAARCDVCKCSFSTFRRRHHCRCCGRTLCNEHSSNQMALPQFGIHSNVRVCYDCFNNSLSSEKHDPQTPQNINAAAESLSKLDMTEGIVIKPAESGIGKSGSDVPECKCGMPLCICVAPVSDPAPVQVHAAATSVVQPNLRPKKAIATQPTTDSVSKSSGSSNSKQSPSLFFSLGQATNGSLDKPCANYEVNGEGLREAIKSNDATAVKKLLSEGVDANYSDRQGLSLLHLAALFNHTEIVFILMDHGASVSCKNAQGETPLDCAPTTLQYKMRRKMEGV